MDRRSLLRAACFAPAALLPAVARAAPAPARRTLRVAAARYLTMNPFYQAHERGFFSDFGLDLEIEQIPSGPQAVPLLARGTVDVALLSLTPALFNAVAMGSMIRIVAGREVITGCSDVGSLQARRSSFPRGLKSLEELRGKRVAIQMKATSSEFLADELLSSAGLSQADMQVQHMRHSDAAVALVNGSVDAIFGGSHFDRSFVALRRELIVWSGQKALRNLQFSHIFFSRRLLVEDPQAGASFLAAYLRGTKEYLGGATPRFQQEYVRQNGIDDQVVKGLCRQTLTPDGRIDEPSLQRFIQWTLKKGYCQTAVPVSQLIDARPLAAAQALLQGKPR